MSSSEYDVVIVGSGAAGMTAAIAAALRGLSVVVTEQAKTYGGTTAYSGGAIWVPGNRLLKEAGVADSIEQGRAYLQATVGETVPASRREAYLRDGIAMVDELDTRTRWMRWTHVTIPDYRPEQPGGVPGGRSVEAAIVDGRALGAELGNLRPPSAALDVKGLTVQAQDFVTLNMVARTKAGRQTAAKVGKRFMKAKLRGQKLLGAGQALTARLRLSLIDLGVPVLLEHGFADLLIEDGRAAGIRCTNGVELRARRGVVLAAGGFSRNQQMRDEHMRGPTSTSWSLTPEDAEDGAVIAAARRAGAHVELMEQAWGMPSILVSKGGRRDVALMTLAERGLPGCIVVNQSGERYANEACSYDDFWQQMYANDRPGAQTVHSWMLFDQRAKNRYIFLGTGPRQPFPRAWTQDGTVHKAATIAELAAKIDVPADRLQGTIERFNGDAHGARDQQFHRGESAYDRFYGDSTLPNPCLAPLDQGPYYAVKLEAGDLGTSGGLAVDELSRVRTADGLVLPGLFAAGNCSAGVMGTTYPGPGATLGAAMVSGYAAGVALADPTTPGVGASAEAVEQVPAT